MTSAPLVRLFQSPFRAGIKIDADQMEPLRTALQMPRVNLFIADDTGLGKTIEAGLIARELPLRRRAKAIVVAAPPSLLEQWKAGRESPTTKRTQTSPLERRLSLMGAATALLSSEIRRASDPFARSAPRSSVSG